MRHITKQQLQTYCQKYPEEAATVEAIENHLMYLRDHTYSKDKVSGSAWIFNPKNEKILLTHHKKMDKWVQPGGHAEKADLHNIQITAQRESIEESGVTDITLLTSDIFNINIDLHTHTDTPYYLYDFCFLFSTTQEKLQPPHDESKQIKWVSNAEIVHTSEFKSIQPLSRKWQLFCHLKSLSSTSGH